jgi:hypothetical protein
VINQGTTVKQFDLKNETDVPVRAVGKKSGVCTPLAIRDTIRQIMQQAVPVIIKTFEEQ